MPATAGAAPAPINAPAPAGGLEFDTSSYHPEELRVRLSGAATTGNGKGAYTNTGLYPLLVRTVRLEAGTAPTGADLVVDVNVEGTSAFSAQSERPKIAATKTTGVGTPARAGNPVYVQPGETVTVDVDAVGSTVAGSDVDIVVELVKHADNNREGIAY